MNEEDQSVPQIIAAVLPQIAEAVDAIAAAFGKGGRLIYIGAGTSGRLGVLDAVECVPTFSAPPSQVIGIIAGGMRALTEAVEGAEDDDSAGESDLREANLSAHDVVVGIAASGRTPYVLGALAYARQTGCVTVGVSCNAPAPVLDAADIAIAAAVGPEVLTGSTRLKAGTAQKLILNMLSTGAFVRHGKVYGNLMVDVQVTNAKLLDRARRIVQSLTDLDANSAARFLAQAGNSAKTAIVMARRGVDATQAQTLLAEANGHLRSVIDGADKDQA
jgi:N-acetylmuramic acid 6-phosphate etherase